MRLRYTLALAGDNRRILVTSRFFQSWIVRSFPTPISVAINGAS